MRALMLLERDGGAIFSRIISDAKASSDISDFSSGISDNFENLSCRVALNSNRRRRKALEVDNWRSLGQILAGLPMRACDGKPAGERALNPAGVTGGNKTHRPYPAGAEGGEQRSRIGMEVASRVDCRGYERVGLGLTPKGASTHEIPPAGRRAEEVPHGWKLNGRHLQPTDDERRGIGGGENDQPDGKLGSGVAPDAAGSGHCAYSR